MNRILFYDDSSGFGGHHVSAIDAVQYLAKQPDVRVGFLFYQNNRRLYERLRSLQQQGIAVELYPMQNRGAPFKTFGALLAFSTIQKIQKAMAAIQPDRVIVVQGSIEQCCSGLLAAKRGKYNTICFIALTQGLAVMGGKLARIRDWLNLYFFSLPDRFIVTSAHSRTDLERYGTKSPVSLVYYGPNLSAWKFHDRDEARQKYGILEHDYVVGMIGRIQFVHKGHDVLIEAIAAHQNRLENVKFMIVGDGPDEPLLRSLIAKYNLQDRAILVPWSQDSSYIYSAIDMLIIPSRFEGLPLVMLEAMYYKLPVVASDVDGMAEVLPREWLFPYGDRDALLDTLLRVKQSDNQNYIDKHQARILEEFNVEKFGQGFYEALVGSKPVPG